MGDLSALQARFATALRAPAAPRGRMAVHHRNRRANFRKALALAYPVLAQLVGEACFAQLAATFQDAHPSRSGDLSHIGRDFPAFIRDWSAALAASLPAAQVAPAQPCFADVAALERAWQECLIAADAEPLATTALAAYPPEDWPALHLRLHPAVQLVDSPWPVVTIWRAHQSPATGSADDATPIRLDAGGERALLRRVPDGAECLALSPAVFAWWRRIADGAPLEQALAAATETHPSFDPAAALADGFALGIVTGCGLRPFPAWQSA